MSRLSRFFPGLLVVLLVGCSGSADEYYADAGGYGFGLASKSEVPASTAEMDFALGGEQSAPAAAMMQAPGPMVRFHVAQNDAGDGQGGVPGDVPARIERKIIYVADISLVVKDFEKIESEIAPLVKRFEGYLSNTSVDRTQGEHRTGRWTARIPVEKYNDFLEELEKLGVPENRTQNAQDVTEEFVDVQARIANKKELEKHILKILEDRDGKIKDIIEVERELARVREEIERMEGRLRYLVNRTSLTTVTIKVREEKDYVPPQAETFGSRIGSSWTYSITSLSGFGKLCVVQFVAFVPWLLLVWVPLFFVGRFVWKRVRSRIGKKSVVAN